MMMVAFGQIGDVTATFRTSGTVEIGDLVSLSDNGEVSTAVSGGEVIGICVSVNGGHAGVQVRGGIEAPYASGLSLGYQPLSVNASGKVTAGTGKGAHLVVSADAGAGIAKIIL